MININEASYSYKRSLEEQLKKISIKINQGEVILLCGKSGSGKTTITKLINGLIPHFLEGNLLGNIL
ncbi:Putative HMP/thiamine import ATP-binding protein YkoD [Peptoniphilus harei]|uniref:HMP/thiamine import ATP-binding protein YkoD n=1 Tax=Peptoniphilus harei TaxID=54005 RepID=A0A2X1YVD8_9FIRM|nr:ATP-binding cassette domain-containing protein [Peptoniphilus harei]SPY36244.1 Putative HMP/thiamine import ATP-binding protein YkoD [Peptoniphilus harei]